jgi:outer membrane cobalamin receptor
MSRAVLSLLLPLLVATPPQGDGVLLGVVRSKDGTPLPQIVLVVSSSSSSRTLVSGPEGRFRAELPSGEYTLAAKTPGLVLSKETRITLGAEEQRVELVLVPAPLAEHVLVAATRGPAPASEIGATASVLESAEIGDREASSLEEILPYVPGVVASRSGGVGLQSSLFVRGGESDFARVLVDGVPVNEPGGAFNWGSLLPLEVERVEIVRGAASSLYGTDALAGVVGLVTRAAGPDARPAAHAEGDLGTFSTRRGEVGTSGRVSDFDWNAGLERLETDNQQPNSALRETAGAVSLGRAFSDTTALRLVARGETSRVGTPGQTAFGRPDLDAYYDWKDLTLSGELRFGGDAVAQRVRAGYALANQLSADPLDSGTFVPSYGAVVGAFPVSDFVDAKGYQNDTRRLTFGYQAELRAGGRELVTLGADLEHETGSIGSLSSPPLIDAHRTDFGIYVQDRAVLADTLFLTLGARAERNGSYGTRVVPRAAVAYRPAGSHGTTLHGSAGLGIKEPSFAESYGVSFFAQGNPALKPERSRTFDLGVEQRFLSDRVRADVTAYDHEYLDQIAFTTIDPVTFQGTYVNLGKTRARGVEATLEAAPSRHSSVRVAYTFLDGVILVSGDSFDPVYAQGEPLLRRPRHQVAVQGRLETGPVTWGASLLAVGDRTDSDFEGLGLTENPGYTRLDARVHVRIRPGLEAFVVGENVADAHYMEVLGYPALGRAIRVGLRYRSAGDR